MGESTNIKTKKRFKPDFKNLIILIFDYIFVLLGYIISLMTLCEVDAKFVNAAYLTTLVLVTPFYTLGMIVLMYIFKLYVNDDSVDLLIERRRLLIVNFLACIVYFAIMHFLDITYPYAYFILGGLFQLVFTSGIRFVYQFLFSNKGKSVAESADTGEGAE